MFVKLFRTCLFYNTNKCISSSHRKVFLNIKNYKRFYNNIRSLHSGSPKITNAHSSFETVKALEKNFLDGTINFVSISAIKQYLLRHNIVFSDGHSNISIRCPVCNEISSQMFINKVTGFYICNNCKKSGNWELLEFYLSNSKQYRGELPDDKAMEYGKSCWESNLKSLKPMDVSVFNFPNFKQFKNLKLEHLVKINAQLCLDEHTVFVPLMHGENVVGFKKFNSDLSEKTFPDKLAKGIIKFKKEGGTAVVVANVKDFLALLNYSVGCDLICLPNGQQSLPQEILPLFEEYEKLILWFDNDVVSWGNVKMFAKKLSESRCCFIRPVDNQPAPYECMLAQYNIENIITNAQQISHSSIVTFANLREDVLAEICNADKVSGVKWERFPMLNSIMKGHRRGELTILTGPTGSGKTTFMSEYSLDLAMNKVSTLWGSFEIRNQRLAKTMLTQMFLAPLEKNIHKYNEWADKFEILPMYFMTFHGQQPIDIVMEAVEHATYVHDIGHVIIDNVQFMLGLSASESGFMDRFYRQDALIAQFRNFATSYNCHVTLVIHPRKEREAEDLTANSIFGGAKAAQEADNILIIQNRSSHSSLKIKKFLQVAKNRFTGDLGIMPLEFDKESLSFRNTKSS